MRLTQCTEAVLLGADALGTDPFLSPLSSHRSLHVAGALMAFKCLTRAHTILVGLVLSWKEDKGETLTHSSRRYFGRSEQWGVWNTPEGNPGQHSSVASRAVAFWMRVPVRKEK